MSEYEKTLSGKDHSIKPGRMGKGIQGRGIIAEPGVVLTWARYKKIVDGGFFKPCEKFGSVWSCQKGKDKLRWVWGIFVCGGKGGIDIEGHLFVKVGRIK